MPGYRLMQTCRSRPALFASGEARNWLPLPFPAMAPAIMKEPTHGLPERKGNGRATSGTLEPTANLGARSIQMILKGM